LSCVGVSELKVVAGSVPIHCHSGVAPASRALAVSWPSSSLPAAKQIGQTSSSPPPSAYCANRRARGRAAVARYGLGVPGQRQPDRLLGEEHRDALALLERGARHQEGDRDLFGILEACGQVDDDLVLHGTP
jgi:hypothetical protein